MFNSDSEAEKKDEWNETHNNALAIRVGLEFDFRLSGEFLYL